MQDRELVAAIAAGDADGLAEAYDRYATPLYTYCRFMLPDPDPMGSAAQAVQDTFIIAAAKLAELTDPDRLRPWLHAVARNECLRRLGPRYPDAATASPPAAFCPPPPRPPETRPPDPWLRMARCRRSPCPASSGARSWRPAPTARRPGARTGPA